MLRVEGTQRRHEIQVPVPSSRRHRHRCSLLTWFVQDLAGSTDAFTVPLTMTNFISLFHFPPYSWPDPHLASSFYSQLHRFMIGLLATLVVSSHIISVPINISFGKDPSLSSWLLQLVGKYSALRFFSIPSAFFT